VGIRGLRKTPGLTDEGTVRAEHAHERAAKRSITRPDRSPRNAMSASGEYLVLTHRCHEHGAFTFDVSL
jgi:hypothetical protein